MMFAFGIIMTILVYKLCLHFKKIKYINKIPPMFIAGLIIIAVLKVFNINYETYNTGASIFTILLGPATIALAFPLIENITVLKKHKRAVWTGLLIATLLTILSTIFVGKLLHLNLQLILSMVPKSVTTPIAVEISKHLGGIPELTACIVILTGLLGALCGHFALKMFNIKHDIAIGLSMGATSHVLGTASCLEKNKNKQAAVSTLALIVVGVLTSVLAPLIIKLIY